MVRRQEHDLIEDAFGSTIELICTGYHKLKSVWTESKGGIITTGIIAALLGLGIKGCSVLERMEQIGQMQRYHYDGQIGSEHVIFTQKGQSSAFSSHENILAVIKSDGKIIKYVAEDDYMHDQNFVVVNYMALKYVLVNNHGRITRYNPEDSGITNVLTESQKQFNHYLDAIVQARTSRGLEDIN